MSQAVQPAVTQGDGCAGWFVRDGRLRSGWRILLYLIVALSLQLGIGIAVGIVIVVVLLAQGVPPTEMPSRIGTIASSLSGMTFGGLGLRVITTLLVVALVWIFRRFIDRRSFVSLGFQLNNGWWLEAIAGFAFAMAMWLVIFTVSLAFGFATITGFAWNTQGVVSILSALVIGLLLNVFVGIAEETDARGYMLQNLAEGIRFAPAVIVSSAYFGILHLLNPGAGLISTAGIFFAGVLLAMGYYATRRLWFSIGLHAAWNFAEGPLFGFLVSGLNMGGLFKLHVTGPEWLMGGNFGPEAGALAVLVEIVGIIVLFVWVRMNRTQDTRET